MTGVATDIHKARGFAFIRDDDGNTRFAHVRDFIDQLEFDFLRPGQPLEFVPVLEETGKRNQLRAVEVRCVKQHP